MFSNDKRITGACINCSNNLELFEIDMEKDTKIMRAPATTTPFASVNQFSSFFSISPFMQAPTKRHKR